MELQLSSGRVVEIERPSVRDGIRCSDIVVTQFDVKGRDSEGKPILGRAYSPNLTLAHYEWAAVGLGVKVEDLGDYSKKEVFEIGAKAQEIFELNPTKEPS